MANAARVVLLALTLSFLARPVLAQETAAPPLRGDRTVTSSELATERGPGFKSGETAFWLSLLGTGVPAGVGAWDVYRAGSSDSYMSGILLVGALVVGPSLGHFYAGRPVPALVGIGIRTLAGAGVAVGVMEALGEGNEHRYQSLGDVGLVLGGASLVWDILSAPHSAHVHNDQVRRGHVAFGIAPSIGTCGLGICARVSF